MTLHRRAILAAGLAAAPLVAHRAEASGASRTRADALRDGGLVPAVRFGIVGSDTLDQTAKLQAAVDETSSAGVGLLLPAGPVLTHRITLRHRTWLVAPPDSAGLIAAAPGAVLAGRDLRDVRLDGLVIDGAGRPSNDDRGAVALTSCRNIRITDCTVRNAGDAALMLTAVSGRLTGTIIDRARTAGIFAIDSQGLEISACSVSGCGDNGILVWRSRHGEDGTILRDNRITRIGAQSGGTGQYGNGINIYRAGSVTVTGNRITDCAFTAVRANESGNVVISGNSCERMGEVALYVEAADERTGAAGWEGAIVSGNLVDHAATGISVTNFNNGGRLAAIEGNVVRNLFRREADPRDKRGEGIGVEADAIVSGNVVEGAPTAGILIGWGKYMREVLATGNLVRRSRIGIAVTATADAGRCLIAQNMISGSTDGAIRAMDHARPIGPDLAGGTGGPTHVTLAGNVAV
jgi:uncharacterized secreted repeat protein (TIGR03808 family)